MKSATQVFVSSFGVLIGVAAAEHGIGEALQGNRAPSGIVIQSWPESQSFRVLDGEPALTIVPNLLISGVLTILLAVAFVVWSTAFAHKKHFGLILGLLCLALFLVGGGFGPPILGIIVSAAASRATAAPPWWRSHTSTGLRRALGRLWPWSLGAGLAAWLLMFPGMVVLAHFFGIQSPDLVMVVLICMFVFLATTIVTGFVRDAQPQA